MENWNIKEETGKQYVYVSKLGNDTTAKAFFGYADVWQSDTAGTAYVIGDRRRSSALSTNSSYVQYKAKTNHTKGATAPNADTTNWEFDTDNYQEYLTTITYGVGSKTVYGNEHYTCTSAGTTGAFDLTKWTKNIVSNKDVPCLTITFNFTNGGTGYNATRFVSYELLDYANNSSTYKIHMILGIGIFDVTTTTSTKYLRLLGLSRYKTVMNGCTATDSTNVMFDTIYLNRNGASHAFYGGLRLTNCIVDNVASMNAQYIWYFAYRTIFKSAIPSSFQAMLLYHVCNCTFLSSVYLYTTYSTTIIKHNYFASTVTSLATANILAGNFNHNRFVGSVNTYATISALRAAYPLHNIDSDFISIQTFNEDYSLTSDSSPLYRTGQYSQNIGATSLSFKQDEASAFLVANGATYKNIVLNSTVLSRAQINKSVVSATASTVVLASDASATDNEYDGFRIKITTGTGGGQTRILSSYVCSTKTANVTVNWSVTPDSTSVYDILDGEVTSAKIDLGRIVRVKSANFFANFISDVNGKYVEVADMDVTDGALQPKLTFEMNYSTDDVTYSGYKKFLIDEPLRIDSNGYGNGDGSFVRANQLDGTLNIRYCYIKIGLREI